MRRNLLVVVLGITFLILITWLGTIITTIVPSRVTAKVQTAQAGPYQISLQVDPNPPLITQPATLSLQVLVKSSQQSVTRAHVTLESDMVAMGMGIDQVDARSQGNGTYLASVQFSMSGLWRIGVIVAVPGTNSARATFEVTAQ
ncbi:MAG: FixH family protein [Ktedonobacteraceae bacterium]